ncbi:hypothetical protein CRG98_041163 [Punica granatum]|uniref:Uncharacterized protein n=1 Tax=Punica granatum TaxID=22663 RepID=A0A2I0I3A4_PUNGR|nr:hypothetical protein CRG98_041163 [Punica granatum]
MVIYASETGKSAEGTQKSPNSLYLILRNSQWKLQASTFNEITPLIHATEHLEIQFVKKGALRTLSDSLTPQAVRKVECREVTEWAVALEGRLNMPDQARGRRGRGQGGGSGRRRRLTNRSHSNGGGSDRKLSLPVHGRAPPASPSERNRTGLISEKGKPR